MNDDRKAFIEQNAVAVVSDKDAKIKRLRKEVTKLLAAKESLRAELRKVRALNECLANRVAAQSELLSRRAETRG